MLSGAQLVANCSKHDDENAANKLTDPTVNLVPTIIFEQPVGVSHKMGFEHSGPWAPDLIDNIEFSKSLADQLPEGGPAAEANTATDEEVEVVGSFTVGGSSGSGLM